MLYSSWKFPQSCGGTPNLFLASVAKFPTHQAWAQIAASSEPTSNTIKADPWPGIDSRVQWLQVLPCGIAGLFEKETYLVQTPKFSSYKTARCCPHTGFTGLCTTLIMSENHLESVPRGRTFFHSRYAELCSCQ